MVVAEPYQEMPPEEAEPPPSKWRRAGLIASMFAVTGLFSAGVASRANTVRGPVKGLKVQKVASLTQRNNSDVVLTVQDQYNDPQCVRNTGGTCAIWGCSSSRGAADCVYWSPGITHLGQHGHYCMCQEGFCAGFDAGGYGTCYPNSQNVLVGSRVAIRNARWMDHHIYIRGWDVYLDNDVPSDRGLWNVYALPSRTAFAPSQFLIMNVMYPDFALTVKATTETHHHRPPETHHTPKISWMYEIDAEWVTTMNSVPWSTQAYIMANMYYPTRYFTARDFSWDVDVTHYYEQPGPQAMWVFDPPLTGPPPPPQQWR